MQQKLAVPLKVRFRLSAGHACQAWGRAEWAAQVEKAAGEAREVANVGQQQLDRVNEGMRRVGEATMQSARGIKRLDESGQEIDESVIELAELAECLELMALNAAIEAVRAGEQGQGCAAIAQEMHALSARNANAARKVAARLRAIQEEVAVASQRVEASITQVAAQCEPVTQLGMALDAISIVAEQIARLVNEPRE